jgi:hypothetical protein
MLGPRSSADRIVTQLEVSEGLFFVVDSTVRDISYSRVYLGHGRSLLEASAWLEQESVRTQLEDG